MCAGVDNPISCLSTRHSRRLWPLGLTPSERRQEESIAQPWGQLYLTPSTWTLNTHFWDALLRADTIWRLVHFFLATFGVHDALRLLQAP